MSREFLVSFVSMIVVLLPIVKSLASDLLKGDNDIYPKSTAQEYCLVTESFEASCLKNEVILMSSAIYGRMRVGRCLASEGIDIVNAFGNDPRFIGCSVDVLHLMDRKCSGRNQCAVRGLQDVDFQLVTPCHVALKSYLEADYECITVIEEDRSCAVSVSGNSLHIMRSSLSKLGGCGSTTQPWVLEAPTGQQINLNLLDFGQNLEETANRNQRQNCEQFGYIIEKSAKKNVSICGLQNERSKVIYKSLSNLIEIVLVYPSMDSSTEDRHILLGFRATGCSDLIPPEDAWLRRTNNEATVGCYSSRQTWQLRCTGSHWTGVIGNCTKEPAQDKVGELQQEIKIDNYQVMIVLGITFLSLAICLCVICTGAICLKRHYANSARKYSAKLEESYRSVRTAESLKPCPELLLQ